MTDFESLVDLACARLGGQVLLANDDFFAEKENLVRDEAPVWDADRYTDRGKWMDGWETRRRRQPGHDWCVLRLGLPGIVRGVVVDTAFFRGNFPESCWLEGAWVPDEVSAERLLDEATSWHPVLPRQRLEGEVRNRFAVAAPWTFTHLRFHIDPDGGVARLRVHGEVVPAPEALADGPVDLAALELGGAVIAASDMFFGGRHHLNLPGPSRGMHDGWETKRRRGPGHDWALLRLAGRGVLQRVIVDTAHFKGNAPGSCSLALADLPPGTAEAAPRESDWRECLPQQPLRPDSVHEFAVADPAAATHARFRIDPDGGVARLRLRGQLDAVGRQSVGLRWFNALPPDAATSRLECCLAVSAWAEQVSLGRPYGALGSLREAAERAFGHVPDAAWEGAFAAHPRIGESAPALAGRACPDRERQWSRSEQSVVSKSDEATRRRLAEGNRRYEERFGRIFLIRAAGRTAGEILTALEARLGKEPAAERRLAITELCAIAQLRLERMLGL